MCVKESSSCGIKGFVLSLQWVKWSHCHSSGIGGYCGSDMVPSLGISIWYRVSKREETREWEFYFTELANIIVEASKCKVWRVGWQAENPGKICSFETEGRLLTEMPLLCGRSFFFLRSLNDCIMRSLIMEDSLFYSESADHSVNLTHKDTFMETSRVMLDQISASQYIS